MVNRDPKLAFVVTMQVDLMYEIVLSIQKGLKIAGGRRHFYLQSTEYMIIDSQAKELPTLYHTPAVMQDCQCA